MQKPAVQVSDKHKSHALLEQALIDAQKKVKVGAIYSHYKYPENHYRVQSLAFLEATDEIVVVYQAVYAPELTFVRPLVSWLENPELNGKRVPRFSLVDDI